MEEEEEMKVFVDTSAWIAFFDQTDDFHYKAKGFLERKPELITSNIVLHECIAHLENRISKRVAEKVAETLIAGNICELVCLTSEQELQSLEKYKEVSRRISFVDVANKVVMEDLGLGKIFAFDQDFKKLSLNVVP